MYQCSECKTFNAARHAVWCPLRNILETKAPAMHEHRERKSQQFEVKRIGYGCSGHFGSSVYSIEGEKIGYSSPSPETMLDRNLPPGTKILVTVEVIEEGSWEGCPRDPQHADAKAWQWCEHCAKEYWTQTRVLEAITKRVREGQTEASVHGVLVDEIGLSRVVCEVWLKGKTLTILRSEHEKSPLTVKHQFEIEG